MRNMKKFSFFVASVLVTAGIFAATAFSAAASGMGTVQASALNVRTAGNTGAPVIGRLVNGTQVTILGSDNGWLKIAYNGGTAWVSGVYVKQAAAAAQTAVSAAKAQLGVKYVYAGASSSGCDCSGLTMYAWGKAGVTLPHSAAQQATKGTYVSRSSLQPGDLVFFDTSGNGTVAHVGIYEGNGMFIHAASGAGKVMESSLSNSYWNSVYVTARRVG